MSSTLFVVSKWLAPAVKAGGPAKSVNLLIKEFRNAGQKVCYLSSDRDLDGGNLELIRDGGPDTLRTESLFKILLFAFKQIQACTVLYLNDFYSLKYNLLPYFIARLFKRPIFIAPRGMLGAGALSIKSEKKKRYLFLLNRIGYFKNVNIHFTDESEKNDFVDLGLALGDKSFILPNFSDSGNFLKHQSFIIPKLKFVSRLSEKKNLHSLLVALQNYQEELCFEIYGDFEDSSYEKLCKSLSSQLPSNVTVQFFGAYQSSDLDEIFSESCFFILPTYNENFGHSIVEALSRGIPILISKHTPWADIENYSAGKLLDISAPDIMLKQIIEFLNVDSGTYQNLRENAYNYFNNRVLVPDLATSYLKAFNLGYDK